MIGPTLPKKAERKLSCSEDGEATHGKFQRARFACVAINDHGDQKDSQQASKK
jgi:hypothetical protein